MSIWTSLEMTSVDRLPTDRPLRQALAVYLQRLVPLGGLTVLSALSVLIVLAAAREPKTYLSLFACLPLLLTGWIRRAKLSWRVRLPLLTSVLVLGLMGALLALPALDVVLISVVLLAVYVFRLDLGVSIAVDTARVVVAVAVLRLLRWMRRLPFYMIVVLARIEMFRRPHRDTNSLGYWASQRLQSLKAADTVALARTADLMRHARKTP